MTEIERYDWFFVESPDSNGLAVRARRQGARRAQSNGAILLVLQVRHEITPSQQEKSLYFGLYVSKHRVREGGGRETESERDGEGERKRKIGRGREIES